MRLLLAFVITAVAFAQTSPPSAIVQSTSPSPTGIPVLGPRTIGAGANQIPAASTVPRGITIITDGASTSDCTTGGGSSVVACFSNGSVWGPLSSSGGGSMVWPSTPGITTCTGTPCTAWGSSLTAPTGAIVGTTDTQTLTNKTVDGVPPAVFGYLSTATSDIQAQINALSTAAYTECKITIAYTDSIFTAASTTATKTACSMPAHAQVLRVRVKHSTAWAGTGITSDVVSLGRSGAGNDQDYSTQFNIFQSVVGTALYDQSGTTIDDDAHTIIATFTANTNFGNGSTTEQRAERARKGAIASAEVRKKKAEERKRKQAENQLPRA